MAGSLLERWDDCSSFFDAPPLAVQAMVQEGLSQRFYQLTGAKRLQDLLGDLGDLFVSLGDLDLMLPGSPVVVQVEVANSETAPNIFHLPPRAVQTSPLVPVDDLSDLLYSTFLGGI